VVVGVLQVELSIPGSESLKDKRRVVRSIKDRLHREHQVSVAETAAQDNLSTAVIGIAVASADGKRAGEVLDTISNKLRALLDAEVVSTTRSIIAGEDPHEAGDLETDDSDLEREMLQRAKGAAGGMA